MKSLDISCSEKGAKMFSTKKHCARNIISGPEKKKTLCIQLRNLLMICQHI